MMSKNKLPLDGWIPGGVSYEKFQPDGYTSVIVRGSVAALVDRKGDLTLQKVNVVVSRMDVTAIRFSNEEIFEALRGDIEPTEKITLSGLSVEADGIILYLSMREYLVSFSLHEKQLSLRWYVDSADWVLTTTDGRGHYLFASKEREEINFMGPEGVAKVVYREMDSNYTLRTTPSRQEFGIDQMFFLSPDKQKVAFYRLNDTQVTQFPVTSAPDGGQMPSTTMLKYPLAGTSHSEIVEVGILDLCTGKVVWLDANEPVCYWVGLTWTPESDALFSFAIDRGQQVSRLLCFDAKTGKNKGEILREESKKYVGQHSSLYFIDARRFLFQTRTYSGYNHIYLFDLRNNSLNQITQGNWEVTQLVGYSAERDAVLYLATKNSPMNRDFFATRLSDGETFSLTNALGTHQVFVDDEPSLWVDLFHSTTEPGVATLGCLACYGESLLLKRSFNPYEGYDLPEKLVGILPKSEPSDDDIYYRITKPKEIREGERLPVVFYVYGGPHVQLITNSWGSGTKGFEEMMADAGCVVFCIDPHGSDNRGFAFESVIRDDLNGPQIRDYKYALNWLFLTQNYVDRERVAIYGWSFGGFMTLSMLLRSGFPFKVGVAGGAVVSWRYYETMYTERYMSLDEKGGTSGEHFDKTDMTNYVSNLKCPLLMIHCCEDPVVLPLHLNYFLSAVNKQEGVSPRVSCYLYPGHEHNVRGPQRVNLMERVKAMIFCYI